MPDGGGRRSALARDWRALDCADAAHPHHPPAHVRRKAVAGAADVTGDFPVVVVVDSGIASDVPGLESWVAGRDSEVAPAYRNTDHGTFVAGLICWGSQLNPTIAGLDDSPCGV